MHLLKGFKWWHFSFHTKRMFCGVLFPKWQHIGGSFHSQQVEDKNCSFPLSAAIPPSGALGRLQIYRKRAVYQHYLLMVVTLMPLPVVLFVWDQATIVRILSQGSYHLRENKWGFRSFIHQTCIKCLHQTSCPHLTP